MSNETAMYISISLIILMGSMWALDKRDSQALLEEYRVQMEKGIELTESCLEELTEAGG